MFRHLPHLNLILSSATVGSRSMQSMSRQCDWGDILGHGMGREGIQYCHPIGRRCERAA